MPGQAIVTIKDKQWNITIANAPWELAQGLGGLAELPAECGMLFDTGWQQLISVTTESMLFPLDIAFLSESLQVVDLIQNLEPGNIVVSAQSARYFLEVNAGELDSIELGDQASVELSTLQEMPSWEEWPTAMWNMITTLLPFIILGAFAIGMVKSVFNNPGQIKVIKTTTEEAAGEAFRLKQRGWTGFGRYKSSEAAVQAGKALGKDIEDITLVESRGAYDLYVRGEIPAQRRLGEPRTEKERTEIHERFYGTKETPARGTGLRERGEW
jgi:uncharacterized membrane protein (UPF0127 family)